MDYAGLISQQIQPSNYREASHHAVTPFAPWSMGSFFFMVVFPTIFYKIWIESLASHYPIVEGNGKNGTYLSLTTPEDMLQLNHWWREEYQGLHFGIIMSRAYTLNMNGLSYFRHIWNLGRYNFLNWEDVKDKFSLEEVHRDFWVKLTEFYGPFHESMLNQQNA